VGTAQGKKVCGSKMEFIRLTERGNKTGDRHTRSTGMAHDVHIHPVEYHMCTLAKGWLTRAVGGSLKGKRKTRGNGLYTTGVTPLPGVRTALGRASPRKIARVWKDG